MGYLSSTTLTDRGQNPCQNKKESSWHDAGNSRRRKRSETSGAELVFERRTTAPLSPGAGIGFKTQVACYHPITGYRAPGGGIRFSRSGAYRDLPVVISCGQCIGCRLEKSRQWAVRIYHESQMHEENCFLTLTYSDSKLPTNGSLNVEDWQAFVKRWRAKIHPQKVRFLQCGEYGDTTKRAHHHAAIFGANFPDRKPIADSAKGKEQWHSDTLDELWRQGYCTISELNYTSGAYIARYILKKITGPPAEDHYSEINKITGEVVQVKPEFITMSRNHGIGYSWFQKYYSEVYPADEVIIAGKPQRPPHYYDQLYSVIEPRQWAAVLKKRARNALKHEGDNTPDRREVKEIVKHAQIKTLTRS